MYKTILFGSLAVLGAIVFAVAGLIWLSKRGFNSNPWAGTYQCVMTAGPSNGASDQITLNSDGSVSKYGLEAIWIEDAMFGEPQNSDITVIGTSQGINVLFQYHKTGTNQLVGHTTNETCTRQ